MTVHPATCRLVRVQAGIGLNEMAATIGVDASSLSRWERGIRRPLATGAIAWARALKAIA